MCHDGGPVGGNNSVQLELIRTTWKYFTDGIIILNRRVLLRRKYCFFDDRLLSNAIEKYKQQVLKMIEDKLKSAKDVSEANGLSLTFWTCGSLSLTKKLAKNMILSDVFQPILGELCHSVGYGLQQEEK